MTTEKLQDKGKCEYCGERCNIVDWIKDGLCPRCLKYKQKLSDLKKELENFINKTHDDEISGYGEYKTSERLLKFLDKAFAKHIGFDSQETKADIVNEVSSRENTNKIAGKTEKEKVTDIVGTSAVSVQIQEDKLGGGE